MRRFDKLCVVGLGYIGLPSAVVFAGAGLRVLGVDINEDAVDSINSGSPHIVEPDLDILLQSVIDSGTLRAQTSAEPADAFILAVPTPFREGHHPDMSFVEAACAAVAPHLAKGNLVILESTSPVGATEKVSQWLASHRPDLCFPHSHGDASDIRVAHCPERVLPGQILREVVENDRVIGGVSPACASAAADLYRLIVRAEMHLTTARTAEMAKLTENAFRDVNIAFANEIGIICDKQGIDVWELIRMANLHPRVNILRPGPGVGGHCIAVDPWFIISANPDDSRLMHAARLINDSKPHYVVDRIVEGLNGLNNPVIACLGLAYKPDVDDLRESPAVEIVEELASRGLGDILAVEPYVKNLPSVLSGRGVKHVDLDAALARADMVVLLVDHAPFRSIDRALIENKVVIDTRGVW